MTDRESFDKWFNTLYPNGCESPSMKYIMRGAWQAATAQAQARIAELEKDIVSLLNIACIHTPSNTKHWVEIKSILKKYDKAIAENT